MTETAPLIYAKMAAVMRAVGGVAKRDRNTHQNFQFRGIDAVMNAVGPVLRDEGVVVVPRLLDATYDKVTTTGNKPATACRVNMEYHFYAEDGSSMGCSVAGEAWDSGDKATPKAMSVAFRTALLQALCLPTDEPDPDSHTYEQIKTPMATPAQIKELTEAIRNKGLGGDENRDARLAFFKDTLGRDTNGGDLTFDEAGITITAAKVGVTTPEQEKMLADSLGAKPIEEPANS